MKSIIEQASSIMKAIEKAWNQAEQPKEFSIKIFEKEERNFFGMTTKPAKIGIFFGDKPIVHEKSVQKPRPEIKECRPEVRSEVKPKTIMQKSVAQAETKPVQQEQQTAREATAQQKAIQRTVTQPSSAAKASVSAKASSDTTTDKPAQKTVLSEKKQPTAPLQNPQDNEIKPRRIPATWNDAMTTSAHAWLNTTLGLMNMNSVGFNSEVAGKNLKLTFTVPLIADITHEKQLFRSLAHLIISSLRNQYKQEIRDLKVILIRPE